MELCSEYYRVSIGNRIGSSIWNSVGSRIESSVGSGIGIRE